MGLNALGKNHKMGGAMKILIALLFMPMAAFAADWVIIGATQDFEIEIDRQSVRPNKGAWFKYINTPAKSEDCAGTGKKLAESKIYLEANCKEFTYRTKQKIVYAVDGSTLEYCGFNNPQGEFIEYAPETVGELYFKAICDPKSRVLSKYAAWVRENKPGNKPLFAECEKSNECSGNLLCKAVAGSASGQCLVPD